jgi:hypoxanthine phosphoribosyltransferase
MKTTRIKDKNFKTFIDIDSIKDRVKTLAEQINHECKDLNPIFIAVLDGSFLFAAELYKNIEILSEICFVKFKSYNKDKQGDLICHIGLDTSVKNRNVIIVEDIVDTGKTLDLLMSELLKEGAASIKIASLLSKPIKHNLKVDYVGFEIPDKFVVGYGLDYGGLGRNLSNIAELC